MLDSVEKLGADNAARLPDTSSLPKVHVPVVCLAGSGDQFHTLRVTADLGAIQSIPDVLYQLLLANFRESGRAFQNLRRSNAFVFVERQKARIECSSDGWSGDRLGRELNG